MSVYIVSDETINKILAGIRESQLGNNWTKNLPYIKGTILDSPDLAKLGEKMLSMNRRAVNYRYNEKNARIPFRFRAVEMTSHVQLLKSIQCFLYQCSEGKTPHMALYKALEKYAGDLAIMMINKTPDWERATWG